MDMIETKALEFAYPAEEGEKPVLALRGVDTAIEKGSFVVVLGHNGSGKSTFAKSLNAILLPCGGKVYVEGMDTQDEARLLEIRRRVGMVFQNPDNQIVANVVEEDVAFAPENLGVARSSGWPLPASSPWSRSASYWTRPPPCWTPSGGRRCFPPFIS